MERPLGRIVVGAAAVGWAERSESHHNNADTPGGAALRSTHPTARLIPMKIAVVCVTYNRPRQLGQMIRCFERQDYAQRELVILDDAGQYRPTEGPGWRLVSLGANGSPALGEKRNAAARLVSSDAEALAVWDDDDLYMPWALRASVAALRRAPWSRPGLVLHPLPDGSLRQHRDRRAVPFRLGLSPRRVRPCRRIPAHQQRRRPRAGRTIPPARHRRGRPAGTRFPAVPDLSVGRRHALSAAGPRGYENWGRLAIAPATVEPADPPLRLDESNIMPGVHRENVLKRSLADEDAGRRLHNRKRLSANGQPTPESLISNPKSPSLLMDVRLIREVSAPTGRGPGNGMFALQRALRAVRPAWLHLGGRLRDGECPGSGAGWTVRRPAPVRPWAGRW